MPISQEDVSKCIAVLSGTGDKPNIETIFLAGCETFWIAEQLSKQFPEIIFVAFTQMVWHAFRSDYVEGYLDNHYFLGAWATWQSAFQGVFSCYSEADRLLSGLQILKNGNVLKTDIKRFYLIEEFDHVQFQNDVNHDNKVPF